jgi:hypothetical protein
MVPLLESSRRKTMISTSKLALIAAVVAIGLTSPVLAQSRDSGRSAYGMVPYGDTAHSPAATGGGSAGYNADISKKTD